MVIKKYCCGRELHLNFKFLNYFLPSFNGINFIEFLEVINTEKMISKMLKLIFGDIVSDIYSEMTLRNKIQM